MTLNRTDDWPKSRYDSRISNIATEFFIPALRESTTYRRIAGLFSSTSLALAARGIKELIDNDGKMQLIVSPVLTREDAEVLNKDPAQLDAIVHRMTSGSLDLTGEFEKNHVTALAYLLKRGSLEIRVEVQRGPDGEYLDYDSIIERNVLDEKLGIFQDREGNAVSFRGPVNENRQSWERGIFEITVDADWVSGQRPHVLDDIDRFRKRWEGRDTLALPKDLEDLLLEAAPDKADDVNLDRFNVPEWAVLSDGRVLWNHQIRAVNSWISRGYRGILSMATSGGKTLAALAAASTVPAGTIVLILVPTKVLVDQWRKEIEEFDPGADLVLCDSSHETWNEILSGKMGAYVGGRPQREKNLIVLATMGTAYRDKFMTKFDGIPSDMITLIADEVHHMGADKYSRIFEIDARRRLGLSATYARSWDEAGTDMILEYFGPELDATYTVADGIRDKKLSRYEYFPFFAYLDRSEYGEYSDLSIEIRRVYALLHSKLDSARKRELEKKYMQLLIFRADLIKKAKDKPRAYGLIIQSSPKKPYIVFADDHDHIDELKSVHKEAIRQVNMGLSHGLEKDDIMTFSGELNADEREKVLEEAKSNKTPLFAMLCLDEGIDVPEFQSAILVSSSTSTRQYIQRRGRILRTSRNKIAYLYDIIVLPNPASYDVDPDDAADIIKKEKARVRELSKDAVNKWDAIRTLDNKLHELGY